MKNSIFALKVSLDKKIYRVIEIQGSKSLYNLASAIVKAFDFNFDHAFGFYNNLKNHYDSDEIYELFIDMEGAEPGKKGVKKIKYAMFLNRRRKCFSFLTMEMIGCSWLSVRIYWIRLQKQNIQKLWSWLVKRQNNILNVRNRWREKFYFVDFSLEYGDVANLTF